LFARQRVAGWQGWGDEVDTYLQDRPRRTLGSPLE